MELTVEQLDVLSRKAVLFRPVSIFSSVLKLKLVFRRLKLTISTRSTYFLIQFRLILRLSFCYGARAKVDIDAYLFASFFSFSPFSQLSVFFAYIFAMYETVFC